MRAASAFAPGTKFPNVRAATVTDGQWNLLHRRKSRLSRSPTWRVAPPPRAARSRQGDQHADETEQMAEREQREDDHQRVHADAFTPSRGVRNRPSVSCPEPYTTATTISPYQPANCSAPAVNARIRPMPNPRYGMKIASPVNTPTGSARSKPTSASADAVVGGENEHHQQLAAQVLAEHGVAFADEPFDLGAGAAAPGLRRVNELGPVHEQVEQHHRHQHQLADDASGMLPPIRAELSEVPNHLELALRYLSTKALMLAMSSATDAELLQPGRQAIVEPLRKTRSCSRISGNSLEMIGTTAAPGQQARSPPLRRPPRQEPEAPAAPQATPLRGARHRRAPRRRNGVSTGASNTTTARLRPPNANQAMLCRCAGLKVMRLDMCACADASRDAGPPDGALILRACPALPAAPSRPPALRRPVGFLPAGLQADRHRRSFDSANRRARLSSPHEIACGNQFCKAIGERALALRSSRQQRGASLSCAQRSSVVPDQRQQVFL